MTTVSLFRGDNAAIGGTDPSQRNVISNNTVGIRIEGDNTTVAGNYLGTNNVGTAANQNGNAVAGTARTSRSPAPAISIRRRRGR